MNKRQWFLLIRIAIILVYGVSAVLAMLFGLFSDTIQSHLLSWQWSFWPVSPLKFIILLLWSEVSKEETKEVFLIIFYSVLCLLPAIGSIFFHRSRVLFGSTVCLPITLSILAIFITGAVNLLWQGLIVDSLFLTLAIIGLLILQPRKSKHTIR